MKFKNLLVISSDFPDKSDTYIGNIFVKEQIRYIKNYFENVYVISPIAYGMEKFRNTSYEDYEFDNVKVYFPKYLNVPLFYFYGRNSWVSLEMNSVLKLIKRENIHFDLIHAHFTWPSGVVASKIKKDYNVPVIITEHTSKTFLKIIKNKDSQYANTWKVSDSIIRVRRGDMTSFLDVGIPLDKVHYVPNGYDPNKFFPMDMLTCRKLLNLPIEKKIILAVGNLEEVKGHKYLVKAMEYIVKKRKDVICLIVGSGKLEVDLKNQIKSTGLNNYIKLVGAKPHSQIALWMNACDIFVLPSLRESFGVVQVEAMACGKPVVATLNGGSEEIIVSDDYGLLCEPGNSKNLAESISLGIENKYDQDKLVNYAKSYNYENISKDIFSIYKTLGNNK